MTPICPYFPKTKTILTTCPSLSPSLPPSLQMKVAEVVEAATRAKAAGSTRFCMGAAWRELGNKKNAFGHILEMVREVSPPSFLPSSLPSLIFHFNFIL